MTFFLFLPTIYIENKSVMENKKRAYRDLSDETKQKISASSTGKKKSTSHKIHISQAMLKYWQGIPSKPKQTTKDDLLGKTE